MFVSVCRVSASVFDCWPLVVTAVVDVIAVAVAVAVISRAEIGSLAFVFGE